MKEERKKEEKKYTVTHPIMSVLFVSEREMSLCEEKEGKKENIISLKFTIIIILMNEDVFYRIVLITSVFPVLYEGCSVSCRSTKNKKNVFLEKIKK